ncbi:MAG: GAF domain-containing protein, partial [Anaerolineae bacterium]|nr:GAF domain-containing protein [Anaerolineae bacterium]
MTSASNSRSWITLFFFVAWIICLGFSLIQSDFSIAPTIVSELMIYALLTAFAAALSLPLSYSRLSVAHAVGILALLSLPSEAVPLMALSLAIGGVLGGAFQSAVLTQRRRNPSRWVQSMVVSALVTVPYFLAGRFYLDILGGTLPTENGLAIGLVTAVYLLVYTLLALLEIEQVGGDFRSALRHDGLAWLLLVILPAPFSVIGAGVIRDNGSFFSFVTLMVGAVLIIFGLFMLSVSQQRLRRQLAEMTIIEETTRAMRSNLLLEDVLQTAYSQVARLLQVNNFTVALLNESQHLTYPLVVRKGSTKTLGYDEHPRDHILIEKVMTTETTLRLAENLSERLRSLGTPELESFVHSWLGVPVLVGDEMRGVFAVFSQDEHLLTDEDTRLLQILVGNLAMAIENARLYEQKSQRVEQLATMNQIAGLLNGTLAISEVLEMIVSSASTISEANAVAIYLLDEDDNSLRLARSAGLSDTFSEHPPRPLLTEQLHSHDLY